MARQSKVQQQRTQSKHKVSPATATAKTRDIRPTKKARVEPERERKPQQKQQQQKSIPKALAAKPTRTAPITPTPPRPLLPSKAPKDKGKQKESAHSPEPPTRDDAAAPSKIYKKPAPSTSTNNAIDITKLSSAFKVVAGSYEKLLYGLQGSVTLSSTTGEPEFHLKPVFIFPAHVSCIKAVSASPRGGKWLATGSSDEIVKVWDLRRRKEIGGLMHHEGSITHLQFPSRSHLLSASEDGTLCLFRARDWSVLRALKGHKGRVNSVAVHPSGKVALSVGKDRTLRMWDFMRGKGVASTKLGKEGEVVRWSTDGTHFIVQSASSIDVYTTDMKLIHAINHPSRIHDVKFCQLLPPSLSPDGPQPEEVLLVGAEDKKVSIYTNIKDEDKEVRIAAELVGHTSRVKALETLTLLLPGGSTNADASTSTSSRSLPYTTIICTISSDGKVRVYDVHQFSSYIQQQQQEQQQEPQSTPTPASLPLADEDSETAETPGTKITTTTTPAPTQRLQIQPLTEYDSSGTRLTCLTLAEGDPDVLVGGGGGSKTQNGGEKRKRGKEEEEEEEEKDSDEEDDDGGLGGLGAGAISDQEEGGDEGDGSEEGEDDEEQGREEEGEGENESEDEGEAEFDDEDED